MKHLLFIIWDNVSGCLSSIDRAFACQAKGCGFESRRHRSILCFNMDRVDHRLMGRALDFGSSRTSSSLVGLANISFFNGVAIVFDSQTIIIILLGCYSRPSRKFFGSNEMRWSEAEHRRWKQGSKKHRRSTRKVLVAKRIRDPSSLYRGEIIPSKPKEEYYMPEEYDRKVETQKIWRGERPAVARVN